MKPLIYGIYLPWEQEGYRYHWLLGVYTIAGNFKFKDFQRFDEALSALESFYKQGRLQLKPDWTTLDA